MLKPDGSHLTRNEFIEIARGVGCRITSDTKTGFITSMRPVIRELHAMWHRGELILDTRDGIMGRDTKPIEIDQEFLDYVRG